MAALRKEPKLHRTASYDGTHHTWWASADFDLDGWSLEATNERGERFTEPFRLETWGRLEGEWVLLEEPHPNLAATFIAPNGTRVPAWGDYQSQTPAEAPLEIDGH